MEASLERVQATGMVGCYWDITPKAMAASDETTYRPYEDTSLKVIMMGLL
jgi:hypothetical protein